MFENITGRSGARKPTFKQSLQAPVRLSGALLAAVLVQAVYTDGAQAADKEKTVAFTKENVFFELNHTDGDLGIHVLVDGDGWKELKIEDPNEDKILDIEVKGRLKKQGLTELFSESAEPSFDDLPPKKFFARFPEGTYRIKGETIDGKKMRGSAELTHVMPAPPGNIRVSGMALAKDCDKGPIPAAGKPVVISWDSVTQSHPDLGKKGSVKVVNYQVVVSREEPTSLSFSVDVPPATKQFEIPKDFIALDSGDGFKFEIVVKEASGNQTVLESCFQVKK